MRIELKKVILLTVFITGCVFSFFGCGAKSPSESNAASDTTVYNMQTMEQTVAPVTETAATTAEISVSETVLATVSNTETNPVTTTAATPAEGDMIIGRVEKISGNSVTVSIAQMDGDFQIPDNFEDMSMPEGMTFPQGGELPEGFEGFDGSFNFGEGFPNIGDFDFSDFAGGSFSGFGNGQFPQNGEMPNFDFADVELTYTGEQKTYTIPNDLKIEYNGSSTALAQGMIIALQFDSSRNVTSVTVIAKS